MITKVGQKYKVYTGNYDGIREGLIVCKSMAMAASLLERSYRNDMARYWQTLFDIPPECNQINVLYTRFMEYHPETIYRPWEKGIVREA